jgi:hypothetical protein
MPKLLPVALSAAFLVTACATATAPSPEAKGAALGLNSKIEDIVANPAGKAVLDKDIPGLTIDPSYYIFKRMSLNQIAPLSHGELTHEMLKSVSEDLAAIPK